MTEAISQLTAASAPGATDLIPATQGSTGALTGTTRSLTVGQVTSFNSTRIVTAAGAVTVQSTDLLIIINKTVPASTTVNLPTSPFTGWLLKIKDGAGNAGTYSIVVASSSSLIDGAEYVTISQNWGSLELVYTGSSWAVTSNATIPAGRSPWLQPFASTDFWNIGIGSGATWETTGTSATAKLITLNGTINTNGNFNQPFYLGHNTDVLLTVTCSDTLAPISSQSIRVPIGAFPSGGTEGTAGTFTGSTSATTLTVTAISSAFLAVSMFISGTGITGTLMIVSQLTGTAGSTGTYKLSRNIGTLGSRTFTATIPGDLHMTFFDKTQPNKMWSYWGCVIDVTDSNGAVTASSTAITTGLGCVYDTTGSGVYPFGTSSFPNFAGGGTVGYDNFGSGTIRDWEITAGVIKHALRYSISDDAETWTVGAQTPVGYFNKNVPWPNAQTDFCGGPTAVTGCGSQQYQTPGSGNLIPSGSTLGIPASTVLTGLGLSAPGLMLATAIQTYGMVWRDSGGTNQIALYTETISGGNTAAVTSMANDFTNIIVPLLRRMTNQSADGITGVNGGGTYPPLLPPVDVTLIP